MVRRIERLRRRRLTAWEIAERVEVPASTVSRILKQRGLGRLWRVDEQKDPPQRYEHTRPGSLVHIDAKKLARINGIGHRIHGDRRRRSRGGGWEVVFVAVDDMTRLTYAEVFPREDGSCATKFLRRALRWFRSLGIRVRRLLTDNARAYISSGFTGLCDEHGIRRSYTRPYTPRTNGKAERLIQTLTRRWAYARAYRSSAERTATLKAWLNQYNHRRPHRGLGMKTPIARLRESREQRP
jgi:transposase InsO family protein